MDYFKDQSMQKYFNELPLFIQENIVQSGAKLDNLEQLKSCAEGMIRGNLQS